MNKQISMNFQPRHLSAKPRIAASRQVWLASLGAAVVTRDWVQNEAGTVFKTLVKEGTAVESRAIRLVGDQLEASVDARQHAVAAHPHTVETTVRSLRRHRGRRIVQRNAAEVAAEDRPAGRSRRPKRGPSAPRPSSAPRKVAKTRAAKVAAQGASVP